MSTPGQPSSASAMPASAGPGLPAAIGCVLLGLAVGAALTLAGPLAGLAAVLGLAVAAAIGAQPLRGLLLFALVAPVIPWTTVNLGVRITLSEALLALTWVAVAWQALRGQLSWPGGAPERRALLLILWSLVPLAAGQLMVQAEGAGPVNYLRWVLNVSPLFLVPLLVRDAAQRRRLVAALMLGYLALLLLSLAVFLPSRDARSMIPVLTALRYAHPEAVEDIFSANFVRMASPWVHPNSTGGALLLAVPVAMFWSVGEHGWRRALGVAVALLGAVGIVLSGSRGAMLCLGVLIAWLAWRRVPYAARVLAWAVAVGALVVLVYPPVQERLTSLFSSQDASTGVRFDEYSRFPAAVARYPLGLGFKVDPPAPDADLLGISNLWLNYMYKLGAPGMLLFIAVTLAWWREARRLGDLSRLHAGNVLRIGSTGAVLAALLTGFIDHYYSFTQVLAAMFWLFMALSLNATRAAAAAPGDPA